MVPKTTDPMTKAIRTLEGILVVVANVALAVIPILTTSLPAELAAKLAAGLDVAFLISRAVVKAFGTPAVTLTAISPPTNAQTATLTFDAGSRSPDEVGYGLAPGDRP